MTTIQVSLPEEMKVFVDEQVARGGFGSDSEYLQALVQEAQLVEAAKKDLAAKLREGLRSPTSPLTAGDWGELKQQVLERSPELREP